MQLNQQQLLVKKIGKIGLLLLIKESYLLFRNSIGLVLHPFKTLRHLRREKDRSQQLLLLGWPFYVLGMGLVALYSQGKVGKDLVVLGIFIPKLLIVVSWTLIGLALLMIGYFGYWLLRVRRVGKNE